MIKKLLIFIGIVLLSYTMSFANQYIFNPYTGKLDNTVVNGSDISLNNFTATGTGTFLGNNSTITFSSGDVIDGNNTGILYINSSRINTTTIQVGLNTTAPTNGTIMYNNTAKILYVWNGTAWDALNE